MRDVNRMQKKKVITVWERDVKHQDTASLVWYVTPQSHICAIMIKYKTINAKHCGCACTHALITRHEIASVRI
jgi:hypothetical protein